MMRIPDVIIDKRYTPLRCFMVCGVLSLLLLTSCSTTALSYSIRESFSSDHFSGKNIGNTTIAVFPFISKEGVFTDARFPYAQVNDTLRERRKELKFTPVCWNQNKCLPQVAASDLDSLYRLLFENKVLNVSQFDTIWQSFEERYLMVFYLRKGMSIYTFNKIMRKRVLIEAEIWDCHEVEVVWRTTVDGICTGKKVTDAEFLSGGAGTIIASLPTVLPDYDDGRW